MSFSNIRLFTIFIVLIVLLCCNVQSRRTRKSEVRRSDRNYIRSEEQNRPTRGFSDLELLTAQGFGKRSKNMQVMNRILMEWLARGNNARTSRTSKDWLSDQDLDYLY